MNELNKNIDNEKTMELLLKMEKEDRKILLEHFDVPYLTGFINLEENDKKHYVNLYYKLCNALENIYDLNQGKSNKSEAEKLLEKYNVMDKSEKQKFDVLIDAQNLHPFTFLIKQLFSK